MGLLGRLLGLFRKKPVKDEELVKARLKSLGYME
jgi:hypothetical protein